MTKKRPYFLTINGEFARLLIFIQIRYIVLCVYFQLYLIFLPSGLPCESFSPYCRVFYHPVATSEPNIYLLNPFPLEFGSFFPFPLSPCTGPLHSYIYLFIYFFPLSLSFPCCLPPPPRELLPRRFVVSRVVTVVIQQNPLFSISFLTSLPLRCSGIFLNRGGYWHRFMAD